MPIPPKPRWRLLRSASGSALAVTSLFVSTACSCVALSDGRAMPPDTGEFWIGTASAIPMASITTTTVRSMMTSVSFLLSALGSHRAGLFGWPFVAVLLDSSFL
uniref:Uncharacterized protein n=1 Tax=Anopheles atroparvus TaxID=41427 RepID=A0AAG5CR68_ANOAO